MCIDSRMELAYLSAHYSSKTKYALMKKKYDSIRKRLTDEIYKCDEKVVYWAVVCQCMFVNEYLMTEKRFWAEDKKRYLELLMDIRKHFGVSVVLLETSWRETVRIAELEKQEKQVLWNDKHLDLSVESITTHLQSLYESHRYTEYCILYLVIHHHWKHFEFIVTDTREDIVLDKTVLHRVNRSKVYLRYQNIQITITDPHFLHAISFFPISLSLTTKDLNRFTYKQYSVNEYRVRLQTNIVNEP